MEILTRIERRYHRRDRLGRWTPVEFETLMTPAVDLAT